MDYKRIVIVGFKRSGTSLLRIILNAHPDIAIGPEMKCIYFIIKKYPKTFEEFMAVTEKEAHDFEFNKETLENIYNNSKTWDEIMENWCLTYMRRNQKRIWGDKTPQNYKYLKLLTRRFPDALYIHIIRNPFDVMGSIVKRGSYKGIRTIVGWIFSNLNIRFINKDNYISFRYEDFVNDTDKYISQIMAKLNIRQADVLSNYLHQDHGRISKGDLWNKPIMKVEETKKRQLLSDKDRLYINILCFYHLHKYGYK